MSCTTRSGSNGGLHGMRMRKSISKGKSGGRKDVTHTGIIKTEISQEQVGIF